MSFFCIFAGMKRFILLLCLILTCCVSLQSQHLHSVFFVNERFFQKNSEQLLETANDYFYRSSADTALFFYNLVINDFRQIGMEHQKRVVIALNRSAILYTRTGNFRAAYDFLIRALELAEAIGFYEHLPRIYTNLGNIYCHLGLFDLCREHYLIALDLTPESIIVLNNLGYTETKIGQHHRASYFLNRAYKISRQQDNMHLEIILNSIAFFHKQQQHYDSAHHYFQLALMESRKNNHAESEAINLSNLSRLFFEIGEYDQALSYAILSNAIAESNAFLRILAENYRTLSKVERSRGHHQRAFDYFEWHMALRDSMLNIEKIRSINQLQHLREMSKVNQQIEEMMFEQQVKEQTIYLQRVFQLVTLVFLMLLGSLFVVIFLKNRNLNTAYNVLVEKNIEIIDLQKRKSPTNNISEKLKLNSDTQIALLDKILTIMDDTAVICDPDFSVNKLADLVNSNQKYVSQVINDTLKKNFRSVLNSYRIREALRLFSEPDASKYTIESVSIQCGFKSQLTFRNAFKEVTGVNPNFYLKSINSA